MRCLAQQHGLSPRIICDGQPLVTTGCGYLPIGYLPTGYLPIGALPTGGAGGGGSLRGRSAAAAALSMAKDAAVASTTIFIMTIPLVSGSIAFRKPQRWSNRRGTPPSSHHHLARAVSTAARLTMLTALTTQPKSACITCTNDPFQESVARIARIQRWGPRPDRSFRNDGTRIRPSAVSAALSGGLLQGA